MARHESCIETCLLPRHFQKMKKPPEDLKRAFSALEFTKAGNLTVLTALLDQQNRIAQTTYAGRNTKEREQGSGLTGSQDATR